jgi:polysaccharide biosynthesis/export protein
MTIQGPNLPILRSVIMLARLKLSFLILAAILSPIGCTHTHSFDMPTSDAPHELAKVSLPEYVIDPPDILKIDALQLVPRGPYKIQTLDILAIKATGVKMEEPISGYFSVDPEGNVNFGITYGPPISIVGLTLDEAKKKIEDILRKSFINPSVEMTIAQGRGMQLIRGEHLVRPDGTVSLGLYGSVRVAGLTLLKAKRAIEAQLAEFIQAPEITVDVLAYNSKVYYVILDQGGQGQRIYRLPITGAETVLDAIGQVSGLSVVSDQHQIWVNRPAPQGEPDKVLAVDWNGITTKGRSETNYQLLPYDRLYVKAYPMVTFDNGLSRVLAPFERMFGFALLGSSTVSTLHNPVGTLGGNQ